MTSILGSIAEHIWAATQSLPGGPPFNAYVEQLKGLSRELRTYAYVNHVESRLAQDARKSLTQAWQSFMQQPKPGAAKNPIWIADSNDWRLKAPPRGDGAITNGGWRCAGAMGQTTSRGDHLISAPFYVTDPSSDTRHCCYCEACALELCGVKCPRYVQCISCGQEAQQGLTSQAKPCWLGPSHVWEPVSLRERILEPKKTREHILLTAPGEQVPVARLTSDQARALGYRLLTLAGGSK